MPGEPLQQRGDAMLLADDDDVAEIAPVPAHGLRDGAEELALERQPDGGEGAEPGQKRRGGDVVESEDPTGALMQTGEHHGDRHDQLPVPLPIAQSLRAVEAGEPHRHVRHQQEGQHEEHVADLHAHGEHFAPRRRVDLHQHRQHRGERDHAQVDEHDERQEEVSIES